jgi:hypothetical protein
MRNKVPFFIHRISILLALVGGFIGVAISLKNGDELGWSLFRGSLLFVSFGLVSRWWLGNMAKAWLESRLESAQAKPKTPEVRPVGRA